MQAIGLRQLSTIIGVAAGLVELVLAFTAVKVGGKSGDYVGIFIYAIPLIMMFGAVLVTLKRETYVGAGIMIITFAVQHVLDHIRGVYILPMVLVTVAVVLALKVDYDALRDEPAA